MTEVTPEFLRSQWREQKRAQRARDPIGNSAKRRQYYAKNREQRLQYQRERYRRLCDAGVGRATP